MGSHFGFWHLTVKLKMEKLNWPNRLLTIHWLLFANDDLKLAFAQLLSTKTKSLFLCQALFSSVVDYNIHRYRFIYQINLWIIYLRSWPNKTWTRQKKSFAIIWHLKNLFFSFFSCVCIMFILISVLDFIFNFFAAQFACSNYLLMFVAFTIFERFFLLFSLFSFQPFEARSSSFNKWLLDSSDHLH